MAAFWTEINKCAVTTNARRSSPTYTHLWRHRGRRSSTFTMAEAIDHLTCLRALCSAENGLSLTRSYILPNTKPCSLLAASGCMSNCPCVGQGVSVSKEPLSGFCEVLFLHPSPWGSMTLCYVSGRNQKLEQSEDVVFCFKRRAITAHCQKPATLLPSFPTPVCSPQLGCQ